MKTDITKHKRALAANAKKELPRLLTQYDVSNFGQLGRICECICQIDEFLASPQGKHSTGRNPALSKFLTTSHRSQIVLVLFHETKCHAYTMHDITRFIRGESVHGQSDNRDHKRTTLHAFVFETNTIVQWLFILCWNWIAGPNIGAAEGNLDSNGPFVHAININGRRIEVSVVESIVLRGAYEFWQIVTNNPQHETTKVFVKFDPLEYEHLLGRELAIRLHKQLQEHGCIPKLGA